MIVMAALLVTYTSPRSLGFLIQLPNVVNGILLPVILVFVLKLVNDRETMGEFANSRLQNVVICATALVMVALSVALVVLTFL